LHYEKYEINRIQTIKTESNTNTKQEIPARLKEFIEQEGKSCSMEASLITPEYVHRMWGGMVALEDIEAAFEELKK